MKLWEVMRLLEEDPSRKFECQDDQKKWLLYADAGCYDDRVFYMLDCWDNNGTPLTGTKRGNLSGNLSTLDNWQPVRQPVAWQEAIQARADGKRVWCEFNNQSWGVPELVVNHLYFKKALDTGKWYVED